MALMNVPIAILGTIASLILLFLTREVCHELMMGKKLHEEYHKRGFL